MDRVAEYRALVKRIIQEYADFLPAYADVQAQTVFDDEHGHYILYHTGWDGKQCIHGSVIHIDIRFDKIWAQHDGTKDGIVDELLEAGVPEKQIVLGFHAPVQRKLTPFAIA